MKNMYVDGTFLEQSGGKWFAEHGPWKARQVVNCIRKNQLQFDSVVDIGCGAGTVLSEMCKILGSKDIQYSGYDISPQAIRLSKQVESDQVKFFCGDFFKSDVEYCDLLLALDTFEHVPDYLDFLAKCQAAARYKIYIIPLDISIQSMILGGLIKMRKRHGHLHYFTAETALETLQYTGHKIVDCTYDAWRGYTKALKQAGGQVPFKITCASILRASLGKINVPWTARWLGGYSLLVLAQ